jgi:hypothetical protein
MARSTAAQLRTLATARKPERMVDQLLESARSSALYGETEFAIPPAHDYNRLSAVEKDEIKQALESLGYRFESRSPLPNLTYMVILW